MNKIAGIFIFGFWWIFSLLSLSGCSETTEDFMSTDNHPVAFIATAHNGENPETRANTDIVNISSSRYGEVKFFIYEKGINRSAKQQEATATYIVPSGDNKGYLESIDNDNKLNWFSRLGKHDFWSWTTPWSDQIPVSPDPIEVEFEDTSITETTTKDANQFIDTSWKNGHALELFIGASTNDLTYTANGEFVNLCYRHLVSKILVSSFSFVDNATLQTVSGVRGNITFYGIPRKGIFYPEGRDRDGIPVLDPYGNPYNRPVLVKDEASSQILTFAVTNTTSHTYSPHPFKDDNNSSISYKPVGSSSSSSTLTDAWFIFPEVDFSNVSFKIEIYEYIAGEGWVPDRSYGLNGSYFGDFKNVTFSRTKDSNYDVGDGSDNTVLHAGEYLILSFNLTTKGNASVKGTISDWSNATQSRQASTHNQKGVYTYLEAKSLADIMKEGDPNKIKEYYEMLGSAEKTSDNPDDPNFDDDLEIIKLMDDIGYNGTGTATSGSSAKLSDLYVANGYIIDGMGHTVNVTSNKLTIGKARDIYFRYYVSSTTNGVTTYTEYIIYIDAKGQVWLIDPETYHETPTEYNINNASTNPFTLNLMNGAIT